MANTRFETPQFLTEVQYTPAYPGETSEMVQRIQEWLCYHNFHVVIDGQWGNATQYALDRLSQGSGNPAPVDHLTQHLWGFSEQLQNQNLASSCEIDDHPVFEMQQTHFNNRAISAVPTWVNGAFSNVPRSPA